MACLLLYSVVPVLSHISLWKIPQYTHESMKMKKAKEGLNIIVKIVFTI